VYKYIYVHATKYVFIYIYIYTYTYTYIFTFKHIHVYKRVLKYTYIHMCMCINMYTYVYICIHICTDTYVFILNKTIDTKMNRCQKTRSTYHFRFPILLFLFYSFLAVLPKRRDSCSAAKTQTQLRSSVSVFCTTGRSGQALYSRHIP